MERYTSLFEEFYIKEIKIDEDDFERFSDLLDDNNISFQVWDVFSGIVVIQFETEFEYIQAKDLLIQNNLEMGDI